MNNVAPAPGSTSSNSHRLLYLLVSLNLILVVPSAKPEGKITDFFAWDLLMLSGFFTFVVGLVLAQSSQGQFARMLNRLAKRGALVVSPEDLAKLKDRMEERTRKWVNAGGLSVALFIAVAFAIVIWPNRGTPRAMSLLQLSLFEVAWGYVAGLYLGRMASYGGVGWFLQKSKVPIRASPGHVDGAAGLKPVGDFCFRQAMITAIPALFLAVWWAIIPAWPDPSRRAHYLEWMHPYLALLVLALVIEVLAFVVPMLWFHIEMKREKERILSKADELSEEIGNIRLELAQSRTRELRDELNEQLSSKTKLYWDIERMPTWPVDSSTLRQFTFRNLALGMPILGELTGLHETWVKYLQGIFESSLS